MSAPSRPYGSADGEPTPPSSPVHRRAPPMRNRPRPRLSQLLEQSRLPQSDRLASVYQSHPAHVRPSVSEMKEPFPLILPDSPAETDHSSVSSTPRSIPELRRFSKSYYDLRAISIHSSDRKPSCPVAHLLPSPVCDPDLEPSSRFTFYKPPHEQLKSEYKSYQDLHILSCYCDDDTPRNTDSIVSREVSDTVSDSSVFGDEDENDDDQESSASDNMPLTPKDRVRRSTTCSAESDWLANTTSHTERLRRFKARCYQVVQHLINRTPCLQRQEDEDQIMLATVLVGPGKPKIIHISRHSSGSSRVYGDGTVELERPRTPIRRHPLEVSAFSPYDTPCKSSSDRDEEPLEENLKSPYFSVSLVPAPLKLSYCDKSNTLSQSTRASSSAVFSSSIQHFNNLADPFGWSPAATGGCNSSPNTPTGKTGTHTAKDMASWKIRRPSFPLSTSSSTSGSYEIPPTPTPTSRHQRSPQHASNTAQAANEHIADLLGTVTSLIESFPSSALHLDSATLQKFCSHYSPQGSSKYRLPSFSAHWLPAERYLRVLREIFPHAPTPFLSALAAWAIVDLTLESIEKIDGLFSETYIPNNCRRGGLRTYLKQAKSPKWRRRNFYFGGRRANELGESDFHVHADRTEGFQILRQRQLYQQDILAAQSNESLYRIPRKARDMLGITLPSKSLLDPEVARHDTDNSNENEIHSIQTLRTLQKRTVVLRVSVGVVGRRLAEAVRSCHRRWNEGKIGVDIGRDLDLHVDLEADVDGDLYGDAWRCVRALVEALGANELQQQGSLCSDVSDLDLELKAKGTRNRRRNGWV